jgi:hypothetical protein
MGTCNDCFLGKLKGYRDVWIIAVKPVLVNANDRQFCHLARSCYISWPIYP